MLILLREHILKLSVHSFDYHWAVWYPLHIMFIVGLLFTEYTWINFLLAFIGWILIAGLGSAVGLHRMLSHRTVTPDTLLRNFISYLGTIACQGSTLFWVALHRGYHHRGADTERDLHSPIRGWWSSYFGWTYRIKPDTVNLKYAVDLTREPFQMFLHRNYYYVVWGTWVTTLLILGWQVALWLLIVPTVVAMHTDYLTNLLGHVPAAGYRNFERNDLSTNVPWLAYLTWGQCWHNNHHHDPNSYDFGTEVSGKWWEWDPCRIFLFLFRKKSK